jgi:hypothetical protein
MAVVRVKGRLYYTKSVRRGGRVTSQSYGPARGKSARWAAEFDRFDRLERQIERMQREDERRERSEAQMAAVQACRDLRERLDAIDRDVAAYFRRATKDVDVLMASRGFYRHARGRWRRRRKPMLTIESERYPKGAVPLTHGEALAERAWSGDPAALERVLQEADRHHHETVEVVLLRALSIGEGPPYEDPTDFVAVKLAAMRHELAPPGSSAAEKLLAERAAICWLHLELLEYEAGRLMHRRQFGSPEAEIIDRRLARAQARLTQAVTALAKVRRLSLPVVVGQINVGAKINGAVQVNGR